MYAAAQLAGPRGAYQMGAALSRQRGRRRLAHLSAITPDQAAQVAMPQSAISKTAGFTQTVYDSLVQSAKNLQLASQLPASCGGSGSVSLAPALISTASGIALKLAPLTGPAAPFVAMGAALAGLFSTLLASHDVAVKKEQQVECAAMPAANDGLTAIYQAVQNGTLSPADGKAALAQLYTEFRQQVASILKDNSSQCNAACVLSKQLKATIAEMSSQFDDMAIAAAQPGAANAISSAIAGAGLPSWVLPAAGFLVLWKLL
jgi:hypothetical protein